MRKKLNLTGERSGRLTATRENGRNKHKQVLWSCICDCGKEVDVTSCDFRSGHTKSCGCMRVDTARKNKLKHGLTNSPIYQTWKGMKARCYNPKNKEYINYGGRGIRVCDRWINSAENFAKDMGEKPSKNHTLERRDNNKGYSPDNCVWASLSEQALNKRNNIKVKINEEERYLREWAKITGLGWSVIYNRIRRGVTGEHLLKPKRERNKNVAA